MRHITEVSGLPKLASPETPEGLPLSWATVSNSGVIHTSGMLGFTPEGGLIEGGVTAETRQTMENLIRVLGAAGVGLKDVGDVKVLLKDGDDAQAVNKIYGRYFPDRKFPARTTAVVGLLMGASVEITMEAEMPIAPPPRAPY